MTRYRYEAYSLFCILSVSAVAAAVPWALGQSILPSSIQELKQQDLYLFITFTFILDLSQVIKGTEYKNYKSPTTTTTTTIRIRT